MPPTHGKVHARARSAFLLWIHSHIPMEEVGTADSQLAEVRIDEHGPADVATDVDEAFDAPLADRRELQVVRPQLLQLPRADPHDLPPRGAQQAVLPPIGVLPPADVLEAEPARAVVL